MNKFEWFGDPLCHSLLSCFFLGCLEKEAWHYLNRHWIYLIGCSSCVQSTIKNILPKGHKFPTENTGRWNLGNLTASFCPGKNNPADVYVIVLSHFPSLRIHFWGRWGLLRLEMDLFIHSFVYLFIYLFISFAKRPGSLTEQAPLRVPEKKEEN